MKKVYQYILMAVAAVTMASCSEKEMLTTTRASQRPSLRLVSVPSPAFLRFAMASTPFQGCL